MVALWAGPGLAASFFLKDSIAWVIFMSWFANVYTCISALSAEAPVEVEQ